MFGNSEKLKLAKFFFFDVIFFKSEIISFLSDFGKLLSWFMEIFFFDFLEINSQ